MNPPAPSLAASFRDQDHYASGVGYDLLPFRFLKLDDKRTVVTNAGGDYRVVPREMIAPLVTKQLEPSAPLLDDLEPAHVITRGAKDAHLELLAAQLRTKHSRLPDLATLHLFVVTLRCDHTCGYCQVSRVSENRTAFDMSPETADRAVDLMLQSPSSQLKVEFQGGESLLNFPLIRHIVQHVEARKEGRDIAYVVATNLSPLTDEMLAFFRAHSITISTSLDGPAALHNRNRPRPGHDAYERTVAGIQRCRAALGEGSVSALMTCTAESLAQPEAIIDDYVRLGFREIFLRHISPYGFAVKSAAKLGYETDRFLAFYQRGLRHILNLNRQGIPFREVYASILLRRMLTAFPTAYVDLQSPMGAALGALVYNYDGDVYASDEGRMLAEMNDHTFRLGNVHRSTWSSLFTDTAILDLAYRTMSEGLPGCSDCAFQPWCGTDPVFHHATQGDPIGHRPTSAFCRRNMGIMRHLLQLLEDSPADAKILRSWAT